MKNTCLGLVGLFVLVGCATDVMDRCQSYTVSGDKVAWSPNKFYQSESLDNILYIEIPKSANYIPVLEVVDTEFDQPYKINYTFDSLTKRFKVEDNHDEYLLYREEADGLHKDKVYIRCNRYLFK